MEGSLLIVLLMGLPILFFMIVWTVGTVIRLTYPERPAPREIDRVLMRRRRALTGRAVPVGVREIREDYHWHRSESGAVAYHYGGFPRHRVPDDWIDDLEMRRN